MVATIVNAGAAVVISVAFLTAMTDGEAIVAGFVFALRVALFETFFNNWLLKDQEGSSRSPYYSI